MPSDRHGRRRSKYEDDRKQEDGSDREDGSSNPLKAVVVDCDYTLWHHAVGEVGAEGVTFERRHLEL